MIKTFCSTYKICDWIDSHFPNLSIYISEAILTLNNKGFTSKFLTWNGIEEKHEGFIDLQKELNIPQEILSEGKRMGLCEISVKTEAGKIPVVILEYELLGEGINE